MKKIINWTFGSFFRSIGRTLAFIFFGLILAWIFAKFNIKLPFYTVKALNMSNYYKTINDIVTSTNNNWQSCTLNGNGSTITLPSSENLKRYYFVYKDLYHDTISDNNFYIFTDDDPFYILVNEESGTSSYSKYYINAFKQKNEITEEQYNTYLNNDFKYRVYHDLQENKYYLFSVYMLNQYKITSTWTQVATDSFASNIYAQNINNLYFYQYGSQKKANSVCLDIENKFLSYEVRFHLNNGKICSSSGGGSSGGGSTGIFCHYEDFSQNFYDRTELYDYIIDKNVTKVGESFVGWYNDINLINLYDFGNELTSNIEIYAKFIFSDVEKLISEINFNEYTFPSDKNFAIINNTNYLDTYLGFQYNFNNIGVFKYNIEEQKFLVYPEYNIFSIGKLGNYYYYHTPLTAYQSEIKYIILDKNQLKALNDSGVMTEYLTFKVSDNATVTFYSDLTNITISDSSGNNYSGDITEVYWNNYNVINNNSDIVGIFRNIYTNENTSIFSYFSQLWYKFKATPIFNYFYLIIIGSFIVFILKVASRK